MSVVVGRAIEQRAVADFMDAATVGASGLILEGDAGIGKTTLWLDGVQLAVDRGCEVLSARAGAAEVSMAFATLADLFGGIGPAVLADLPAPQRLAVDRVLDRDESGPATDEHVVGAAVLSILRTLVATRPVLLAIDDLQWMDASSRTVLGFAARRLTGRLGILGTVRSGTDNASVSGWLRLAGPQAVMRVRVAPLDADGLQQLLSAGLGRALSRTALARIVEMSGGNPFYALELAHVLDERSGSDVVLPETLAALVDERIGRLGSEVSDVLLIAAAAAAPTVASIATACGLTDRQVVTLLEEAESRGVISLDGNRVRFTHPLLSAGVYGRASPARRRAAHRALSVSETQVELRARHLALAAIEGDEATLAALDAAADAALTRGAPAAAAELVELSIRLGSDDEARRLRHAELLFRAGAVEQARLRLEPLIDETAPGSMRARALSLLGAVWVYATSFPKAVDVLIRALGDAREDAVLTLLTLLRLAPATGLTGDREKSIAYARRAVACANDIGVDALRSQALTMWVNVSLLYGLGFDEPAMRTALELERPGGDDHLTFQASAVEAATLSWRGRPDEARPRFASMAQRCDERGAEAAAIWVAEHTIMIDIWLGRYRDAARAATAVQARADQIGGQHVTVIAAALRAVAAAYLGEAELARGSARIAIEGADASGGKHLAILPRTSLGFLEVSVGDYSAALTVLAPLLAGFDPAHGTEIVVGGFLPDAVEALVAVGRPDDAEPLVAALEANGARLDRPWMRAVGARGRAMLQAARGDLVAAVLTAERAMIEHDQLPMPFERARTQLLLGQLQRRRRNGAATVALREALNTFETLGSAAWATRARAELAHLDSHRGGRQLTAGEKRIADLAATGLSNKQIAAAAFVAEKTVEMNLSRVYRKLGIRSRAGLSAALRADEEARRLT